MSSSEMMPIKLPNERSVGIEMLRRETVEVLHTARLGNDGEVGDGAAALHQSWGGGAQVSSGAGQQDVSRYDWQGVYWREIINHPV